MSVGPSGSVTEPSQMNQRNVPPGYQNKGYQNPGNLNSGSPSQGIIAAMAVIISRFVDFTANTTVMGVIVYTDDSENQWKRKGDCRIGL